MAGSSGTQQLVEHSDPQTDDESKESSTLECAICLQPSLFPVKLPCSHIFCFLCVKGITLQSKRCAMCRQEIPDDYIFNPVLVNPLKEGEGKALEGLMEGTGAEGVGVEGGEVEEFMWFYKGRNGWWQYDLRTSKEIENHHKNGDRSCEMLIAGFLYVIDFEYMLQYRRNDPSRRRQVKRDKATQPKKGVAGLRIGGNCDIDNSNDDDNSDNTRDSNVSADDSSNTTADLSHRTAPLRSADSSHRSADVSPNSAESTPRSADIVHRTSDFSQNSVDSPRRSQSDRLRVRATSQNQPSSNQESSSRENQPITDRGSYQDSRDSLTSQIRTVSDQLRSVVNDLINLELDEGDVNEGTDSEDENY